MREALSLKITMMKSTQIVLLFLLFLFAGNTSGSASTETSLGDNTWVLVGEPGAFSPAGWASEEILALTRVQAVRMGLVINEFVDERFDPIKGKRAALSFYNEDAPIEPSKPFQYKEGHLLLEDLADEAGVPLRTIEESNPHLRRDILPVGTALYGTIFSVDERRLAALSESQASYQKSLEEQYERRRKQVLSFMPDLNTHQLITYSVRSGDYLGKISVNTGASVDDIRKWNRIRGNTIYAGQKLHVWVSKSSGSKQPASVVTAAPMEEDGRVTELLSEDENSYITYEVKPGDTLWGIASKFPGVSAENIKSWNKVDELIKAGEQLRIRTHTITDYSPDKYPSAL